MQTSVSLYPRQCHEGMPAFAGSSVISRLADSLIYGGKAVMQAVNDVTPGNQSVELFAGGDADIPKVLGIAIAPIWKQQIPNAPYAAYLEKEAVSVMRKGSIWVVIPEALTDLSLGVYVKGTTPGGTPPTASLGSFAAVPESPTPTYFLWAAAKWTGYLLVESVHFGRVEINMP